MKTMLIFQYLFLGLLFSVKCQITDNSTTGNFVDLRDGHLYKWVKIGNQTWMAENLAYLPSISSPEERSNKEKHYYVYDYYSDKKISDSTYNIREAVLTENYKIYGVLYNWMAAMDDAPSSKAVPSGVRGACPTGWHLPSDEEWKILEESLGGAKVCGLKLKSTAGWNENGNGTNESNFSALPGGMKNYDGYFIWLGVKGYWWTSTEALKVDGWHRTIENNSDQIKRDGHHKTWAFYVRCVKDE